MQHALPREAVLIEFVSYRPFFVRNARGDGLRVTPLCRVRAWATPGSCQRRSRRGLRDREEVQRVSRVLYPIPILRTCRERARALYQLLVQPIANVAS